MNDVAGAALVLHVGLTLAVALTLGAVGLVAEVRDHVPRIRCARPAVQRPPWRTAALVGRRGLPRSAPPSTSLAPCPERTTVPMPTVRLDDAARAVVRRAVRDAQLHVVVAAPPLGDPARYRDTELHHRDLDPGLASRPVVFLEVDAVMSADPTRRLDVRGLDIDGYPVLRVGAAAVAPALAAVAVHLRARTGARPHLRFAPAPCGRFTHLPRYVLLERTARRTRSLIHTADGDVSRRPVVHLDG